jgi:hypothetical protein
MSGQFHAPATLPPKERAPLPSEQQAKWAPEPVATFWRRQKSLSPPTQTETQFLGHPVHSPPTILRWTPNSLNTKNRK